MMLRNFFNRVSQKMSEQFSGECESRSAVLKTRNYFLASSFTCIMKKDGIEVEKIYQWDLFKNNTREGMNRMVAYITTGDSSQGLKRDSSKIASIRKQSIKR